MASTSASVPAADCMPTGIPCDVEYHRLAHKALWHLLEQISAEDVLLAGDRCTAGFLRCYFNAWRESETVRNAPGTKAFAIRGILCLLDASRENAKVSQDYLALVDSLFGFVHQWGRELRAASPNPPPVPVDSTHQDPP